MGSKLECIIWRYTNIKSEIGYYVGTGSNSYSQSITSVNEGYNNALYFPYRGWIDSNRCYATWLASPSAYDASNLMSVRYCGDIYSNYYTNDILSVRPIVHLKSGTRLQKVDGVWRIQ